MRLRAPLNTLIRFALVGVGNTAVDFLVTNLLIFSILGMGTGAVLTAGFLGAAIATLNSYLWNKYWTFASVDRVEAQQDFSRFLTIAGLGILVNTSAFLFLLSYLPRYFPLDGFLLVNISKLMAVAVTLLVTFLGYRFKVFKTLNHTTFKRDFFFEDLGTQRLFQQLLVLGLMALGVRLAYLSLTQFVFGDGVNYARVAQAMAEGQWNEVDTFWVNLYCFWAAPFHLLPWSAHSAAIAGSFIPGTLLVLPVAYLARILYGRRVAWVAGFLCVFHPRLVEYSVNGYTETSGLFLLASLAAATVAHLKSGDRRPLWVAAVCLGAYVGIRNEGLVLGGLYILLLALCPRFRPFRDRLPNALRLGAGASLVLVVYMTTCLVLFGNPCFFQKRSNLYKSHSEQLDPGQAARATYGEGERSGSATFDRVPRDLPRNLTYLLERLPGVLLSPAILFALLLPELVRRSSWAAGSGEEWAIGLMAVAVLFIYPFIQVEPRLFFPVLIPVHIWGAAGMEAFSRYLDSRWGSANWGRGILGLTLGLMIAVTIWRGEVLGKRYLAYENLARWIQQHVPGEERLYGGGYGYISNTGFLVSNPVSSRLWSHQPDEVVDEVRRSGGRWLVLYEGFLQTYNPELLPVLESGLPGAVKRFETQDGFGLRSQIYELTD